LFEQSKAGKPGVFMPIDPASAPGQSTFHTEAVDISSKVPEEFLNRFGIHRPLGKKDPVHAVLMPNQVTGAEMPQGFADFNPQNIDSAVQQAMVTKPGEVEKPRGVVGKVGQFLRGQGRAAASAADVGINAITGTMDVLAYPLARAYYGTQMSPEAAAEKAKAETTSPKNVVGRAFGVSETPEYKGEASQQLMNYIGANMDKGADVIARETGLPKADVESYMNTLLLATPSAVKAAGQTKLGQVIKTEAGYAGQAVKQGVQAVTPQVVQRGVVRAVEAVAPGTTTVKPPAAVPGVVPPVVGQPTQAAPYAQPGGGRVSVGAAATPDATIIKQALQTATPEFQQLYGNMALDNVNTPVVLRHLEGDSLPVPVRLTEGQATGVVIGSRVLLMEQDHLGGRIRTSVTSEWDGETGESIEGLNQTTGPFLGRVIDEDPPIGLKPWMEGHSQKAGLLFEEDTVREVQKQPTG
jgi:hypothetical protein